LAEPLSVWPSCSVCRNSELLRGSGGGKTNTGNVDKCIRFWNTVNKSALSCVDTGSPVCNLFWSKNVDEIVSTHGCPLNQIMIWKCPSMSKVTTLTGHHNWPVVHLTIAPNGQTIVTGAGDEKLRFWNVFPGMGSKVNSVSSVGSLLPQSIR